MRIEGVLKNFNILVCDDSITVLRIVSVYLQKAGANVITAKNGLEGLEILKTEPVHLLISDINMPRMDGFQLFDALNAENISVPRILITDADIDEYIHLALDHDIGNILSKPIEMVELVLLCHKLITGNKVFGLKYYFKVKKIYKFSLIKSQDIQKGIEHIQKYGKTINLPSSKVDFLSIILDEVLSNSIYHAHGFTKQKERKIPITLDNEDRVEVAFASNSEYLGISVTDFKGALTKNRILTSFLGVIEEKRLIAQAVETGEDISTLIKDKGRGLQMIRLMSNTYYFNIKKNKMTQVIIMVNLKEENQKKYSSIKINELY